MPRSTYLCATATQNKSLGGGQHFEIDEEPSLLTLNCADYDISPDADYDACMILEPEGEAAETEAGTANDAATHGEAAAAVGMEA